MEPPLHRDDDADGSAAPPSTASSASLSPPAKRRRTAVVPGECCRTCRLRKVKCTGNPGEGPCSNCSRLELTCSFVVPPGSIKSEGFSRTTPSHIHTEAGTLRKRAQRACSLCHAHKTKCSGDLPKCKRCEDGGFPCEYMPTRRRFTHVRFNDPKKADNARSSSSHPLRSEESSTISPASSLGAGNTPFLLDTSLLHAEDMLLRKDVLLTHLDAYLQYLYSVPCLGFLHPEITYQEIQEDRFPPAQAAALCSVASFFVNPGEVGRQFGKRCSQQVDMYLYQNISKFSENALILFALNILFNLLDGSYAKTWQCIGVASRLMIGLQLNWDVVPPDTTFIKQECLRRVAWQLFNVDRLLAGGYDEYVSCRAEHMKIRLPCDEAAFRENRPVVAERLHDKPGRYSSALGLHGIQIRLIDLRHRILGTTKKLAVPSGANVSHLEPSQLMADINALQNELTRIHASIPEDLRLSDQSISRYAASEQWRGYVFFHTHMAICYIELYRFSLPGPRNPASIDVLRKLPRDFLARSQKQAVAHALCLARFVDAIRNETEKMPNAGPVKLVGDYSVAHMTTLCLRVLFVALQYNLYQDLADHTTAPLWRGGPTSEAQIWSFIDTMIEIAEPWGHIYDFAKQAYECNRAMREAFTRTRKPASNQQNGGLGLAAAPSHSASNGSRLPGPDLLLEQVHVENGLDEHGKSRAADMPVANWWMGATTAAVATQQHQHQQQQQQPSSATTSPLDVWYPLSDVGFDVDHGPPGVPMFLAQARSSLLPLAVTDMPVLYDPENDQTFWTTPESGSSGYNNNNNHHHHHHQPMQPASPTGGGMSMMMTMDENAPLPVQGMYQQQQQQQQYMPSQQAGYTNGYAELYQNGHGDSSSSAAYMQQNYFGEERGRLG